MPRLFDILARGREALIRGNTVFLSPSLPRTKGALLRDDQDQDQ